MLHLFLGDKALGSFDEYVQVYCPHLSIEDALEYADKGKEFLELFCMEKDVDKPARFRDTNIQTIVGYILWCLIKLAYDSKKPFGKGMFNITSTETENSKRLYNFLNSKAYSRISSHYRKSSAGHRGIDEENSQIPWPWQFRTVDFGLCEAGTPSQFLYFKPERYGFDVLHHPFTSVLHLIAWSKFLMFPDRLPATETFRETDNNPNREPWQKGKEIYVVIDPVDVTLKGSNDNSKLQLK